MVKMLFILGTVLHLLLAFCANNDESIRVVQIELICVPFNGHYRIPINSTEALLEKSFYRPTVIEDPQWISQITDEIALIVRPENLTTETLKDLRIHGVIRYSNGQSVAFLCSRDSKVMIGARNYKGGEGLISMLRTIFGDTDDLYKGLPPDN